MVESVHQYAQPPWIFASSMMEKQTFEWSMLSLSTLFASCETFTSCETTHTAKGLTPEAAFANGVDSTYVLCDDQYVIDRRPMHEEWIDSAGIGDFVNNHDQKTPSRVSSALGSERRGGGFGSVSANTTPHLAFGTRFTPSPGRKPLSAKRSAYAEQIRHSAETWSISRYPQKK